MKGEIFKHLRKHFSQLPLEIDRLIVSAYFFYNNLKHPQNIFLRKYIIDEETPMQLEALKEFLLVFNKYESCFNFETLIELFEFVISPSDKIVNGAVYTPEHIRQYIVDQSISLHDGDLINIKAGDLSCGCGGFLLSLTQKIKEITNKSFQDIYRKNIYGIDIAEYSIERTKILLSIYAVINGEDLINFQFNLYIGNSITFNWRESSEEIDNNNGFDIIVGNPPYVCSRNMDADTLALLKNLTVSNTGHPDLYIPFFQIGIENLNPTGILSYITVNTFIKSINGRALRRYFDENDIKLILLNFGGEQVFQDRNTYTCICFITRGNGQINYIRTDSSSLNNLDLNTTNRFDYDNLNHHDGWNLVNNTDLTTFIDVVESTGLPFKQIYNTKNGIATLRNEIYKFTPINEDENFYYHRYEGQIYPIEKAICKDIINANKIKCENDLIRLREKIIFPYNSLTEIIPESIMERDYPNTYLYLSSQKELLSKRDKGNREYEVWYAYGRRQSMDIQAFKLFFPHICERPNFVICEDRDLLFYNGLSIISNDLEELLVIKKLMESNLFFEYIRNTTKDYASGYISMSRNYLKNFGVYQFNDSQRALLLSSENVNEFLEELYDVNDFMGNLKLLEA